MENNYLIVKDEDGHLILANVVEEMLNALYAQYAEYSENRQTIEDAIKGAMLNAGIKTASVGKYVCKVREYYDDWVFDVEAFKQNEAPELVAAFTETTDESESFFDMDAFKAEQPEMYMKYFKTVHKETQTINTSKLCKLLPDIYYKYAAKIPAKPATISIKEK